MSKGSYRMIFSTLGRKRRAMRDERGGKPKPRPRSMATALMKSLMSEVTMLSSKKGSLRAPVWMVYHRRAA